jgi:hypothetical protein
MRRQLAVGADDSPPRQTHARCEHVADGTCRTRISGSAGNFPVADNLASTKVADHRSYFLNEGGIRGRPAAIVALHGA